MSCELSKKADIENNSELNDNNGILLLINTVRVLDELAIFKKVEVKCYADGAPQNLTCYIRLTNINIIEHNWNTKTQVLDYIVDIGVCYDSQNDIEIARALLSVSKKVRNAFSKKEDGTNGILLFNDVTGHYNTTVSGTDFNPKDAVFTNNIVLYGIGVSLTYRVQENIGD